MSPDGFVDAAWWPRSIDLQVELPALLAELWSATREINRITYNTGAWDPVPRVLRIRNRVVRLGGFSTSDASTIRLTDAWGAERIDMLVIPPETDKDTADRALTIAGRGEQLLRPAEILAAAAAPRTRSVGLAS